MDADEFDKLMKEEHTKWVDLGVDPGTFKPNEGFLGIIFRFEALFKALEAKGLITEDDVTEQYREVALSGMRGIREHTIEPMVKEMRKQMIVQGLPTMRVPKGKMH